MALGAVGVFAVGEEGLGRVAGDVGEDEFGRQAKQLADDPGNVAGIAMFEHVGADHAVDGCRGQGGEVGHAGVVAAHLFHSPIGLDGIEDRLAAILILLGHPGRPVLPPLAGAIIENGLRPMLDDQALDRLDEFGELVAGKGLLGRQGAFGPAVVDVIALGMHLPIVGGQQAELPRGTGPAEFEMGVGVLRHGRGAPALRMRGGRRSLMRVIRPFDKLRVRGVLLGHCFCPSSS